MNALPNTLQRISHTKLFAVFAIAFFLLISASLVIMFSSLSVTPSFEHLQSLVTGNHATTQLAARQPANKEVLGTNINVLSAPTALIAIQEKSPAFVTKESELEGFMVFITGKLGLSEDQSIAVIRESNAVANQTDADYFRVSFLDSTTMQRYFPAKAVNRFYFYIIPTTATDKPRAPEIKPIKDPENTQFGVVSDR